MAKWYKTKSGGRVARLGHGLELRVEYESYERLLVGAPAYCVAVLGQRLVDRSADIADGKMRAEAVARSWLSEARVKLGE